MKKRSLTTPELMFIIATRAALAAGVALLISSRLRPSTRTRVGMALAGFGGATTFPAARILTRKRPLLNRVFA